MQHRLNREAWVPHIREPLAALLRQGVSPGRLALSIALGLVFGLLPVLGISTVLCALAAITLRLNLPAIQLVNYLVTPVQLLLIIPQLRFGEWLTGTPPFPITLESGLALLSHGALNAVTVLGTAIGHASLAWIVLAPPVGFVLFHALAAAFRRLPLATLEVTS
ncbi:MAG TPA: DUF2062 domain-containing protein [Steroidobacteraceae bacterium]|nr:DUF2062 domain-containing protein [Steroidobacteraceae bacterium]